MFKRLPTATPNTIGQDGRIVMNMIMGPPYDIFRYIYTERETQIHNVLTDTHECEPRVDVALVMGEPGLVKG